METITEALTQKIPHGYWCDKCPYLIVEKPHLSKDGSIQSWFCDLMEEYIYRKECGINEGER